MAKWVSITLNLTNFKDSSVRVQDGCNENIKAKKFKMLAKRKPQEKALIKEDACSI